MPNPSTRITEALQVRNMSQAELSEATGISKSSISMYISNKYEPKRRNLEKMAAALRVNSAWLSGEDAPMDEQDADTRMFARRLLYFMETQGRGPNDLAEVLGVKEAQVIQWINGIDVGYIPIDDIAALGEELDVAPAYLMGWTDDPVNYEKLGIKVPSWFDGSSKGYLRHLEIAGELKKTIDQNEWSLPLTTAYEAAEVPTRKAACNVLEIPYVVPNAYESPSNSAYLDDYKDAKKIEMLVYDSPAAAGLPLYAESDFERISFPADEIPSGADFGIRICGDSMEPTIEDGSIVWVHKQNEICDGRIGIFMLDDSAVCKRARLNSKGRLFALESDNSAYKPIKGGDLEGVRCVGKVLI